MDTKHKIDQFFREGLDQMEIMPQTESWQLVQQQLAPGKQKSAWIWISGLAACLGIITFFSLLYKMSHLMMTPSERVAEVVIDHPEEEAYTLQIPPLTLTQPLVRQGTSDASSEKKTEASFPQPMEETSVAEESVRNTLQLQAIRKTAPDLDTYAPEVSLTVAQTETEIPETVKITYISGKTEKTHPIKLGEIIETISKDATTSHLLASFRDVKDNLIKKN